MAFNHVDGCDCPMGCCGCGDTDDNKTDVFYNPFRDEFFFLVEAASSRGPVGWEIFDGFIYLGKLGDNYLEYIGRMQLHSKEIDEHLKKYPDMHEHHTFFRNKK